MRPVVIDTNVAVVAERPAMAPQASEACQTACVAAVKKVIDNQQPIAIDRRGAILREYINNLGTRASHEQPAAFLLWVLRHQADVDRCEMVDITPTGDRSYHEFPDDPALSSFDDDDHKFVAVALVHPERPPVLVAVDSDWWRHRVALRGHGLELRFLCPDALQFNV